MQVVVERLGLQTRYVEQQTLRNVELYTAPIEMRLAGDNPKSGFSFLMTPSENGNFALADFKIGKDEIDTVVEGHVGDTLSTPAGRVVFFKTDKFEDFKKPIRILNIM